MSSDSGERLPDRPRVDFALPDVLDIKVGETRFVPPNLINFTSSLPTSDGAVEFVVQTAAPIPIRALGPAIFVGRIPVIEMTVIGENTYRFVAPSRRGLQQNAPIQLGWSGQPPTAQDNVRFRYRLSEEQAE